jgi:diguanylate cyclase (GGDEF)-like protein
VPIAQPRSGSTPATVIGTSPAGASTGGGLAVVAGGRSSLASVLANTVGSVGPLPGGTVGPGTQAPAGASRASASGTSRPAVGGPTAVPSGHVRTTGPPSSGALQPIVNIPTPVWIALAVALTLAAVTGTTALWSGFRMRRQGARLKLISAAALTDPLTGVLNRRGFTEAAERELARARRHDRPFTLAYVDVRGLKRVNDSEGHRAGDELLRQTARLLTEAARVDDVVGRIGGDELAMMLVEQDATGAEVVKRRIAAEVVTRRAQMGLRAPWDLTIGTAVFPEDGASVDELLRKADLRLYEQRGIALG